MGRCGRDKAEGTSLSSHLLCTLETQPLPVQGMGKLSRWLLLLIQATSTGNSISSDPAHWCPLAGSTETTANRQQSL